MLKVPERERRRRYTTAQKLAIVRECPVRGASLAGFATAHQANANMVRMCVVKFQLRGFGEARDTGMKLLPVAVRKPAAISAPMNVAAPSVTLKIEMPRGVVGFYAAPDLELLKSFVGALTVR